MCDGLRIGGDKCSNGEYGVQDWIYSFEEHFDDDITDATDLAQSIIDRLDKKMNQRASFLRNLSSVIRSECASLIANTETESLIDFEELPFSGNENKAPYLPNDMEYSSVYENTVSLSSPTFKIPNGVDINDENVQRDARISQLLDATMLNLHDEYCVDSDGNYEYCAMYFGTINGVFRVFPGAENSIVDGSYADYDPRFRPWYVSAATGSKDVVILLDISGSMRQNNRIDLAKEAVTSVLSTLGSSSFVNVVAFSDSLTVSCFEKTLVPATSRNVAELTDFVNNLTPQGLTDFTIAFNAAFDILQTATNCQTSILFLTDGIADDVSSLIEERNTVDINAVVFSYTLGDEAETTVPLAVAELTNGIYTHIDDEDENLITAMSSYYLYYAYGGGSGDNDDIIFTSPYFDFDTDVVMITMAMPVYVNDTYFVGVVGVDIPLTFLSEAIGDITIGRKSYSFVINEEAEVILHPLIASDSDYKSTLVNDVEPQEFNATILQKMLKRESGALRITAFAKQSAGNVVYNGYIYEDAELLYIYSGVGPSSLSIAFVIYSEFDVTAPFVPSAGMVTSPSTDCDDVLEYAINSTYTDLEGCLAPFNLFHRFDLMTECDSEWLETVNILNGSDEENMGKPANAFYEGKLYTTDYPNYFLQNGLFEEQYDALDVDPTCEQLKELHTLTNRLGAYDVDLLPFGGFREEISQNILNSIYTLSSLHEFWKPTFLSNDSSFVSMFFAHYQGLHIDYPGKVFPNWYNSLIRPWYQRAISYPNLMVWTMPYYDATGNRHLVTGASTVIYAPFSDYAFGVIGFNYEYGQFVEYWKSSMSAICDQNNKQYCFLIDSSAFCLYYEGMEDDVDDDDISIKFFGDLEPTLMQSLLDRGFFVNDTNVNYQDDSIDITYIIDSEIASNEEFQTQATEFAYNSGEYRVYPVAKTNLYVIYIDGYHTTNIYPRTCPDNDYCSGVVSPGCLTTNSGTECQSATTDVCIKPDSTAFVSDFTSCSVISDIGFCVLQNEENSDMCASNFIGNECDEDDDDDDGGDNDDKDTTIIDIKMIIVIGCVVFVVSVFVAINMLLIYKGNKKKQNDDHYNENAELPEYDDSGRVI